MRMAKPKVQNQHLMILLARAQVRPWMWRPESLKVRFFRHELKDLYPHLHFWNRKLTMRPPPLVSCLTCGNVHEPGPTVYHYLVVRCKECPGEWEKLPWQRRIDLEHVCDNINWFMAFLSDLEYNYYCDEVLALWQANILNS